MDTGATKHIVQENAEFMKFHCYLVGSQTIILGLVVKKMSLEQKHTSSNFIVETTYFFAALSMHVGCDAP